MDENRLRRFSLNESETISCYKWLNDHCDKPYKLLKNSIDEFSWGLEQIDVPTGFEQYTTALEMTLLPQNQPGKKQMLANRISAFLGNFPVEVQQIHQKVLDFYRFRSESLHEGNGSNITESELHELENMAREVLKKCLMRCKAEYNLNPNITWDVIKDKIMNELIRLFFTAFFFWIRAINFLFLSMLFHFLLIYFIVRFRLE